MYCWGWTFRTILLYRCGPVEVYNADTASTTSGARFWHLQSQKLFLMKDFAGARKSFTFISDKLESTDDGINFKKPN